MRYGTAVRYVVLQLCKADLVLVPMPCPLSRRRAVGGPGAGGNDRKITGGTRSDPAAIFMSSRRARSGRERAHAHQDAPPTALDHGRAPHAHHHPMPRIASRAASHTRHIAYAPHADARHASHCYSRPTSDKTMHSPVYGCIFDVTDFCKSSRAHRARIRALPPRHRTRRFAARAENTPSQAAPCSPLSRTASFSLQP